ncbi:hypothetical protein COT72_01250 [archaeon CG10_big_fil_rev_8_21_14_0_10_43_11]|nr:MAG: hypothetical protein COT72_01250 [archaeon CG10_big_fil_rev_8_21_14_0_10_43_11]
MKYIDVHAHTWELENEKDILTECKKQGILVINNGTNPDTNAHVLKADSLKAVGWWPHERAQQNTIETQAQNKEVIALGEIGLDFYYQTISEKQQRAHFTFMLALAKELDKPVIVHSRKAESAVLDVLKHYDLPVVLHSFTGKKSLIKEGVMRGYYFSVPTIVVKASNFQTLVKLVPETQLLTETDTPYMGATFPNTPLSLPLVVEKINELKEDDLTKTVFKNAKTVFSF